MKTDKMVIGIVDSEVMWKDIVQYERSIHERTTMTAPFYYLLTFTKIPTMRQPDSRLGHIA